MKILDEECRLTVERIIVKHQQGMLEMRGQRSSRAPVFLRLTDKKRLVN